MISTFNFNISICPLNIKRRSVRNFNCKLTDYEAQITNKLRYYQLWLFNKLYLHPKNNLSTKHLSPQYNETILIYFLQFDINHRHYLVPARNQYEKTPKLLMNTLIQKFLGYAELSTETVLPVWFSRAVKSRLLAVWHSFHGLDRARDDTRPQLVRIARGVRTCQRFYI